MAKKGTSSSTRVSGKDVAVRKDKSCSTTKKPISEGKAEYTKTFGSEIDEIFSSKKRKEPETEGKVAEHKVAMTKMKKKKKSTDKPTKDIKGPLDLPCGQRKRMNDGLVVYTEEELGFGKSDAGGTRLCPFDCDCCF
ncbi:Nucleolar protein 56-like [Heracleum sosnowskyi]|uniref:Nucleolar protein 56-like n=1 Tax=Heracleum sosnowskyi TaxID=360622 RepID=A0AAD8HSU3_9APIA|nr:Nucleolar protein 56-like [Heracleum sosnowskyi]